MPLCCRKKAALSRAFQPSAAAELKPKWKKWKLPRNRNATSRRREADPSTEARITARYAGNCTRGFMGNPVSGTASGRSASWRRSPPVAEAPEVDAEMLPDLGRNVQFCGNCRVLLGDMAIRENLCL